MVLLVGFFQNGINIIYNWLKRKEEKNLKSAVYINGINRSIQLNSYTCAPHSLLVILQYFNLKIDLNEIKTALQTGKEGTDTEPILDFLRKKGLKIKINEKATLLDIKKSINQKNPLLITINNWEHWCIIYGYSCDGVLILNSWFKKFSVQYKYKDFLQQWDDNWIAAVSNNK
jgi:ABC-type bacteriocin/lantibiotic exporter with double-glycine peptidase domain